MANTQSARKPRASVPDAVEKPVARAATAAIKRKKVATAPVVTAPADAKVVRDGFTMPQEDYDLLKTLKAQCLKAGIEVKKSELLRAGVQALAAMPAAKLAERLKALPTVKAGRRKNKD